jgi:predicted nucleic acid-binding Zn ribbon protein
METGSVTYDTIKNRVCVVCGAAFKVPRAGKLFCSAKCKQFNYYHKEQIIELEQARKGISNEYHELSLKEYNNYSITVKHLNEYHNLQRRVNSTYSPPTIIQQTRMEELENGLPNYLKQLKFHFLSIEEWSFIKILYPRLKKDEFFKLIDNLGSDFLDRLDYKEDSKKKDEKNNSISNLYKNHIYKIAEGKIKFV